jgi:hypothetical protein
LLLHVWLIEVKRVDATRRGGVIVPPRLSTHRLLLGKDVPEDQKGHESNEPAVSKGRDQRRQVVDHSHAWEHFCSEDHFSHHRKGSETNQELGKARKEAAHEFEHIVHDVRVLRFGLQQIWHESKRVSGTPFFLINTNSLKVTQLPENTGDSGARNPLHNTFICSIFAQNGASFQDG